MSRTAFGLADGYNFCRSAGSFLGNPTQSQFIVFYLAIINDASNYRVFQEKMAQSLRQHNFAAAHHRVMQFSAKCSNCLHITKQHLMLSKVS